MKADRLQPQPPQQDPSLTPQPAPPEQADTRVEQIADGDDAKPHDAEKHDDQFGRQHLAQDNNLGEGQRDNRHHEGEDSAEGDALAQQGLSINTFGVS